MKSPDLKPFERHGVHCRLYQRIELVIVTYQHTQELRLVVPELVPAGAIAVMGAIMNSDEQVRSFRVLRCEDENTASNVNLYRH